MYDMILLYDAYHHIYSCSYNIIEFWEHVSAQKGSRRTFNDWTSKDANSETGLSNQQQLVWPRVYRYKLGVVDVHVGCNDVSHGEDFHRALSARHKDAVRMTRCIHGHADEVDASASRNHKAWSAERLYYNSWGWCCIFMQTYIISTRGSHPTKAICLNNLETLLPLDMFGLVRLNSLDIE